MIFTPSFEKGHKGKLIGIEIQEGIRVFRPGVRYWELGGLGLNIRNPQPLANAG